MAVRGNDIAKNCLPPEDVLKQAHSKKEFSASLKGFGFNAEEIYDNSYYKIAQELHPGQPPLAKERVYERMNNLKSDRHGKIIESTSPGWYQFRENLMRGYVRLRAAEKGVLLGRDLLG